MRGAYLRALGHIAASHAVPQNPEFPDQLFGDCVGALQHLKQLLPPIAEDGWPETDAAGNIAAPKISVVSHFGSDTRYRQHDRPTPLPTKPLYRDHLRWALGFQDVGALLDWRFPRLLDNDRLGRRALKGALRAELPPMLHTKRLALRVVRQAAETGEIAVTGDVVARVVRAKADSPRRDEQRDEMFLTPGRGADILTMEFMLGVQAGAHEFLVRVLDMPLLDADTTNRDREEVQWARALSTLEHALSAIRDELPGVGSVYIPELLPLGAAKRQSRTLIAKHADADQARAWWPVAPADLGLIEQTWPSEEHSDLLATWRVAGLMSEEDDHDQVAVVPANLNADEMADRLSRLPCAGNSAFDLSAWIEDSEGFHLATWLVSTPRDSAELPPLARPRATEPPRSGGHIVMTTVDDRDLRFRQATMDTLIAYSAAVDIELGILCGHGDSSRRDF